MTDYAYVDADEFASRYTFIKASESPTLAAQKERAFANRKRQLKSAIARGYAPASAMDELDREIADAEERKADRDRIDATAREQLEQEAEEAAIGRAKARLRHEAEAMPEGRRQRA
jgi:hypothetical protein